MPRKNMRVKKSRVKKPNILTSKVDDKLQRDVKKAAARWGVSRFLCECAESLVSITDKGEEVAEPIRLLTTRERRILDRHIE